MLALTLTQTLTLTLTLTLTFNFLCHRRSYDLQCGDEVSFGHGKRRCAAWRETQRTSLREGSVTSVPRRVATRK